MNYINIPKTTILLLSVFLFFKISNAQLVVTNSTNPPYDPIYLIENVFLGAGVDVLNVAYTGDPIAIGYFDGSTSNIGINDGLIMTSGSADLAVGPNLIGFASFTNTGVSDPDLALLTPGFPVSNSAVYTIDFIPYSDSLSFRYVFASEEYDEYVCSGFNDAFGFFISGPGFTGPYTGGAENIALIPGTTTPVSIDNVNNGGGICGPTNVAYYVNNLMGLTVEYDAFTTVLEATVAVVPCSQYTIKLAIGDVGDEEIDSGVFLQANSFGTPAIDVEILTVNNDTTVVEGCSSATVTLTLGAPSLTTIAVPLNLGGTAINGTDYLPVADTVFFPPGQTTISFVIDPIVDNLPEGTETITFTVQSSSCTQSVYTILIEDQLPPPVLVCAASGSSIVFTWTAVPGATSYEVNVDNTGWVPANGTLQHTVNGTPGQTIVIEVRGLTAGLCPGSSSTISCTIPGQVCILSSTITHSSQSFCNNICTNILDATVTGGTLPIQYLWNNGETTASISNLCPGNSFTVTVTDADGCVDTATLSIVESTVLPTISSTNVSCNGGTDGSATATGTGGTPAYTYVWSNAQTAQTITGLSAGIYTVTVTDNNGCLGTATVNLTEPPMLAAVITSSTPTNCSNCDGTATLTASGGTPPYLYQWSNGTTTQNATNLCTGINTVTVTDSNNCTSVATVNIGNSSTLGISGISIDATIACNADCTGAVTVTPTGGTPPYIYDWGNGQTTATATGLCAGSYTVTVNDVNGCTAIDIVSLTEPSPLTINIVSQTASNCTSCDGTVDITTAGGTPSYVYIWSNGSILEDPTNLCQGINTVTVTDANGCTGTATVIIGNTSTLAVDSEVVNANVSCFGACDGSATVTVTGGITPYVYQWDSGQIGPTATGLCAGTYFISITDASGCLVAEDITITEPGQLLTGFNISASVSCNGDSDGTASVTPSGGTPGYTYHWNTGMTTSTLTNLPAGTYSVTVTDANGCTETESATIIEPGPFSASAVGEALNCFGDTDGDINLTVIGGTLPYVYTWSGGLPAVEDPSGLTVGTYTVTVTDNSGCTVTASSSITQPTQLVASTSQSISNCGGCNGVATISVSGGTPVYTYSWNNGQSGSSVTGLCSGTYSVTVTDNNGCVLIETITLSQPNALNVSATVVNNISCFGGTDGAANVNVSGGTGPFSYLWDNNETTNPAVNLNTGTHTVTVSDANGCSSTASVNLTQPTQLQVSTNSTNVTCNGIADGTASANATGGVGPYTYNWPGGFSGPTIGNLSNGNYNVTTTDANGCTIVSSITITQPALIVTSITGTDEVCGSAADGTGTVTIQGGVSPFTFLWDNNETTNPAVGLSAGIHTVTITDSNGCIVVESITIGAGTVIVPSVVSNGPTCFGLANGAATASAIGGVAPYTYTWNTTPIQTGATINNLPSGPIVLDIVDATGCSISVTVTIDNAPTQIGLTVTGTDVTCFGNDDGSATVIAMGGTPSYTYNWSNSSTAATAFNLSPGNYMVTVTDANGCDEVTSVSVGGIAEINASVNSVDLSCFGGSDGIVTVDTSTISGGMGPYLYSLNGVDYVLNNLFVGLPGGSYTIYIKDVNGCVVSYPITVTEPAELLVDAGPDVELELGDSVTLSPILYPIGTTVLYDWTPGAYINCTDCPNPTSTPFESITYTLLVQDTLSGCTADDMVTITVDKSRDIFIPNAFTPNGDGTNDVFMIFGGSGIANVRTFNVFDRWDEPVFEASDFQPNDPVFGWDGRFREQLMNPAVYVYYAEVEFIDGEVLFYKGDVTLIR